MTTHKRIVNCVLAWAPIWLSGAVGATPDSIRSEPSAVPLRYATIIDQFTSSSHVFSHVLYDRGQFRVEHLAQKEDHTPLLIDLFDGNPFSLVWTYDSWGQRAAPSPDAAMRAFSREVQRLGEAKARQMYGVPADFRVVDMSRAPSPTVGLRTLSDLGIPHLERIGQEKVAGFLCDVYHAHIVSPNHEYFLKTADTFEGNPIRDIQVWVEPRSQLVLRLKERDEFPPAAGVPPMVSGYQAESVRFPAAIPLPRFQLPPGTTAKVPKVFEHVRLPRGVKRERSAGSAAGLGIGFDPSPGGEVGVTGH